jgi:hypothetical protein
MSDQDQRKDLLNFTRAMPVFCAGCGYSAGDIDGGKKCCAGTDPYWACVRAFRSGKVEQGPVSYHEATGAPVLPEEEPEPSTLRFEVVIRTNDFTDVTLSRIGPVDEATAMDVVKELTRHEDFRPLKHSIKIEPVEE